ncbi:MAG: universal stress protein [Nitrosopumilus sp.]|nr:universal stress protein [Nitrosopumilus sp.]
MTKIFEHILIPYNGTPGSQKAFKKAISIASLIQAKITILTCIEERPTFGFFKTKTSKQEFEKERKLVEKQHLELEKIVKKYNISFSSKIVKNDLASVNILEFSKQHDVDLIIMTKTKLTSRYEKQHYQSTIENVFRNSPCPILIL